MRPQAKSKPSSIHGKGWFAVKNIQYLESIKSSGIFEGNHGFNSSCKPNVEIVPLKTKLRIKNCIIYQQVAVALRHIKAGEELTVNYGVRQCNCEECR